MQCYPCARVTMQCNPRLLETLLVFWEHVNINADHIALIKQRDWSVSYAYVTNKKYI